MDPAPAGRYDELAKLLDAIASPVRLEILHRLRSPHAVSDIRVTAGLTRGGERPDRPLARQTVTHHLEQLEALGLVQRVGAPRGDAYVLHPASLFALVDEVRRLAKLRPVLTDTAGGEATVVRGDSVRARLPPRPRLLVAYGREDAEAFPLADRARIGRSSACEIVLDYDPYVSGEHARLDRTSDGWTVTDLGSRNGTWVDWDRLPADRPRALLPGSLLAVGRSVLVFQG